MAARSRGGALVAIMKGYLCGSKNASAQACFAAVHDEVRESLARRGGCMASYATVVGFVGHAVGETHGDLQALIAAADGFAGPAGWIPQYIGEDRDKLVRATTVHGCLAMALRQQGPRPL